MFSIIIGYFSKITAKYAVVWFQSLSWKLFVHKLLFLKKKSLHSYYFIILFQFLLFWVVSYQFNAAVLLCVIIPSLLFLIFLHFIFLLKLFSSNNFIPIISTFGFMFWLVQFHGTHPLNYIFCFCLFSYSLVFVFDCYI